MSQQQYTGAPYTGAPSSNERNLALAAHLGSIVTAFVALGLIAPLVVYLVSDGKPFAKRHAAESLNFQITLLLASVVGGIVALLATLITLGLAVFVIVPVIIAVVVLTVIFVIQASAAASRGEDYRYPMTLRLVS